MESILNKYSEKKKQEEQTSDKFEKLLEVMLNKLDIMTFERTISKIVHDGYLISVNGITYKLQSKSIDIVKELFKMFSEDNIRNPVKSFTDNIHICSFLEDVRPYSSKCDDFFEDVRPYPKECHDFLKHCNEMIKQSINDKIVDLQNKKDRTSDEEALLEKSLKAMELITATCMESDSNYDDLQKQYNECMKQYNECMKQTCKEIINQQDEDDCTPEEKALLEKCLNLWKQIATDSCMDSDLNQNPKIIFHGLF